MYITCNSAYAVMDITFMSDQIVHLTVAKWKSIHRRELFSSDQLVDRDS